MLRTSGILRKLDSGLPHHPLDLRLVHLWLEFEEDQMINHELSVEPVDAQFQSKAPFLIA